MSSITQRLFNLGKIEVKVRSEWSIRMEMEASLESNEMKLGSGPSAYLMPVTRPLMCLTKKLNERNNGMTVL